MKRPMHLLREPDVTAVRNDGDWIPLTGGKAGSTEVSFRVGNQEMAIQVTSQEPLSFVLLQWKETPGEGCRLLGDCWERDYGMLGWHGILPHEEMPWYFLVSDGRTLDGYGVQTGCNAFCSWFLDGTCTSLLLDIRSGGTGVTLDGRVLSAASVVSCSGSEEETVYETAARFCRKMNPSGSRGKGPYYGGNNWYYAYGNCSQATFETDCRLMAELSDGLARRPYMVVDAGWEMGRSGMVAKASSLWDPDLSRFPDIRQAAENAKQMGVRPGIWYRPLLGLKAKDIDLALAPKGKEQEALQTVMLDPSRPEVLERVSQDITRLKDWGFELIKHDFSTYDILGVWGPRWHSLQPGKPWQFADTSRTSAEIIKALYQTIRDSAGDTPIIGCNTVSHLAAGVFEIMRVGDDTSGRQWERTRKMGINSVAFRMPQEGTFYEVDGDCVGITGAIPWELNRQWMDLVARSGTALFLSLDPKAASPQVRKDVRKAFRTASEKPSPGVPLDWMDTALPRRWAFADGIQEYTWTWPGRLEFCEGFIGT